MAESNNELQSVLNNILDDKEKNLLPSNLRKGVTVLGVQGKLVEGIDTSDADATSSDIANGKTAYVKGKKVTGDIFTVQDNAVQPRIVEHITKSYGEDYIALQDSYTFNTLQRTGSAVSLRITKENLVNDIGLTSDQIVEGNTVLGVEGTGKSGVMTEEEYESAVLTADEILSSTEIYKEVYIVTDILQVCLESGATVTTESDQRATIPFDRVFYSKGTGLSVENGIVTIGKGIKTVKVTLRASATTQNRLYGLCIQHNEKSTAKQLLVDAGVNDEYQDLGEFSAVFNVQEGDTIFAQIRSVATTGMSISLTGGLNTNMLIEGIK